MRTIVQTLVALSLTACGAAGSPNLSLSAKGSSATSTPSPLGASAAALSATSSSAGSVAPLAVTSRLQLQRVRLVLSDLELGSSEQAFGSGTGTTQVVAGPVVIDLDAAALTGAPRKLLVTDGARKGEYSYARFRVRPLEQGESTIAPDLVGVSVRVDGTFDGAPFTFTSSLATTVVLSGRFEIGMDDMNLTLALDAASWFSPGGVVLDPTLEANRAAIESKILASLRLFGDHDRDGLEDMLEGEGSGQRG